MDHLRKNFAVFCRTLATAPAPVGDGAPDVPPVPKLSIVNYQLIIAHSTTTPCVKKRENTTYRLTPGGE